MAQSQLSLTDEQRTLLVDLLESARKETLIEEHRTRAPTYREHVTERSELIADLLAKLGQSVAR